MFSIEKSCHFELQEPPVPFSTYIFFFSASTHLLAMFALHSKRKQKRGRWVE